MEGLRGTTVPNGLCPPGGGQGVLSTWRSVPMEDLRGTVVLNGPGLIAGGKGIHAKGAVGAYGGSAADGSSQRPGPTS